ncbi:hypothetical protein X961_4925 [Burkholderia pseudomallei MSHR5613]|uniref:Uncharacterized protein n=1 Tax=Burkholderia pseudomallei 1710a TaxID=320371 RepID=A0A0E1VTW5_BURPE|nr:hypothetical protein BMA10247_A1326 [Burkholderia mallei NCTC 10247]EDO88759.1 hypothetical protein BURPS406E_C1698 [Burkholderia pseudomallei 406e]EES22987.1 hypothetical protein BURPS1106B_0252 [Burkholderia pseudomallei 1106b]EET04350.1 hypothetical protein BURPS1710A_A0969 [Burkholderia pseudomallei 1710a]KGC36547.1 hypothetical protein DO64_5582 [Burkholderia pseudomallei]KGR96051.1 hypothetical protein X948_4820 [Burkholderia pseudomallei MSHR5608]KGS04300.1 hypothetical protein X977
MAVNNRTTFIFYRCDYKPESGYHALKLETRWPVPSYIGF